MILSKRYYFIFVIALIILGSISISAFAVGDIDDLNVELDKTQQQQTVSSGSLWLEFLKLVVVLGLIVGAAWSIVRLFSKQVAGKMQGTWMRVVDEVTLGQNRGIVLCEVGEKLYAIGVSDNNINLLFEVDNPKLLEEVSYTDNSNNYNESKQFDLIKLKDFIYDKLSPKKPTKATNEEFHMLMSEQIERLARISDNVGNELNTKRSGKND